MSERKVKLGLYGCGNRTRALLDSVYYDEEYEVVAAYDISEEFTKSACKKYGGKICDSPDELINSKDVEAFIISLDPFAHPLAFYQTIEAEKPIFIEKPVAMTAEEVYKMMKTAEEKNVLVQVGFMRRYLPNHVAARKFIAENDPGKIFSINGRWFHPGETEMINCLQNAPDNFRLKVSQIPFHCCHMLDVILLYGGSLKSVSARGIKVIERQYPSPDEVIATLEFENGTIGSFHYSSMAYRSAIAYVIHAENYTLTFDEGLEIWYRPKIKSMREDGSRDCRPLYHKNIGPETHKFIDNAPDYQIMLDFFNSVRAGKSTKVTLKDALKVAEFAEAIERSWKEQKQISLPLYPISK